jgi:hypothetical protein
MAVTAQVVINNARQSFPDMSETIALDLLNLEHGELLARYPLRETTLDFTSIVADTPEYALAETAIRVDAAYYYSDADTPKQLEPLSVEEMDRMDPGWRTRDSGTPTHYYISASATSTGNLGLYPVPDTTTSSGYPKVTLYIRQNQTLGLSDNIPNGMLNYDAYLAGICLRYAERRARDQVPFWQNRKDTARNQLEKYLAERGQNHAAVIKPAYMRPRRTI